MDEQNQQKFGDTNFNFPAEKVQVPEQIEHSPILSKPKVPIPVRILSILMLFSGALSVMATVYLFYLGKTIDSTIIHYPFSNLILVLFLFSGVAIIAVAHGLGKMKKWALYFVAAWLILAIPSALFEFFTQFSESLISVLVTILFNVTIVGYLWIIRNKFEPEKYHQPVLIVAICILAALLFDGGMILISKSAKENQEKNSQALKIKMMDISIQSNLAWVAGELEMYFIDNQSYAGFSVDDTLLGEHNKILEDSGCKTSLKIDISPDGQKFMIHEPLCSDPQKSACIDNKTSISDYDSVIEDTATIEKTYSCK